MKLKNQPLREIFEERYKFSYRTRLPGSNAVPPPSDYQLLSEKRKEVWEARRSRWNSTASLNSNGADPIGIIIFVEKNAQHAVTADHRVE